MSKIKTSNNIAARRKFLSLIFGAIGSFFLPVWSFAKRCWPARTVEKSIPKFNPKTWQLTVDGLVENSLSLNYEEIKDLPFISQTKDLDCVERWSVKKIKWEGVQLKTIIHLVKPKPEAKFLTIHCSGGTYSESLSLKQALSPDVILAYNADDKPLKSQHGGPLRLVVPGLWGYKSAKWIERIEFVQTRHLGYWEQRGYGTDSGPKKAKIEAKS